jgi:hypothetical protein
MRRIIAFVLFFLVALFLSALTLNGQCASDSFGRASLGSNWTAAPSSSGTLAIVTLGELALTSGPTYSSIYWSGSGAFSAQQASSITIGAVGDAQSNLIWPTVENSTTAETFYGALVWQGQIYIQRTVDGMNVGSGSTNMASNSYTPQAGDTITINSNGSGGISVTYGPPSSPQSLSVTDPTPLANGLPGIAGYARNNSTAQWLAAGWSATGPGCPTLSFVSPASGGPGTVITVTGTNFVAPASGYLTCPHASASTYALTSVSLISSTSVTAIVPTPGSFTPPLTCDVTLDFANGSITISPPSALTVAPPT